MDTCHYIEATYISSTIFRLSLYRIVTASPLSRCRDGRLRSSRHQLPPHPITCRIRRRRNWFVRVQICSWRVLQSSCTQWIFRWRCNAPSPPHPTAIPPLTQNSLLSPLLSCFHFFLHKLIALPRAMSLLLFLLLLLFFFFFLFFPPPPTSFSPTNRGRWENKNISINTLHLSPLPRRRSPPTNRGRGRTTINRPLDLSPSTHKALSPLPPTKRGRGEPTTSVTTTNHLLSSSPDVVFPHKMRQENENISDNKPSPFFVSLPLDTILRCVYSLFSSSLIYDANASCEARFQTTATAFLFWLLAS